MKQYIEINVNWEVKKSEIRPKWKAFWLAFIPVFLMVTLQLLGVRFPHIDLKQALLFSPLPKQMSSFDLILPKLQKIPNTYHLKESMSLFSTSYAAADYENASAYAVIDFDTGDILLQKNLSERLSIASLTKIMTAIVAMDLALQTDTFTVSQHAASVVPTRIGMFPGQTLTLSELLEGMLMTSGNDAAQVIQEGIDAKYHEPVFIKAMNEKASFLHLTNTHFVNPQGYDDSNQYSSVKDLAILSHYALTNYPLIARIVQKDFVELRPTVSHGDFKLYNWNGLLDVYPHVFGVKIGNTDNAGFTMVVGAKRNDKQILAIVLGADTILDRDEWASELLDEGFSKTLNLPPVTVTEDQLRTKYATWQS